MWAAFEGTIFEEYPYLLPNVFCTIVVLFGLTVGILFLEETHEDRKYDHDRGREAGQWLSRKFWKSDTDSTLDEKEASMDELKSMLGEHTQAYQSTSSSPTLCSTRTSISDVPSFILDKQIQRTPTTREAFTKQICINIVCYGILAL